MRRIDTLVIGGGQAGLAMSRCLSDRGIDHLVVERGQIAERWRRERWDSLRLLTPNWMTRLPGFRYAGPDPNGYMRVPELVALLDRYAETSAAPVVTGAAIASLTRSGDGYVATGDAGTWTARQVVIATGHCDTPFVPAFAAQGASRLHQLVPGAYRNPAHLPPGGVLIVGASASGLQLADELVRAGRRVILSAGQHTRVPRLYRGADFFSWLDRLDILRDGVDAVYDVEVSRAQPSFQLVGRPSHDTLDLRGLAARGVGRGRPPDRARGRAGELRRRPDRLDRRRRSQAGDAAAPHRSRRARPGPSTRRRSSRTGRRSSTPPPTPSTCAGPASPR